MKKAICALTIVLMISMTLYASDSYKAIEASFPVFINDTKLVSDKPIVTINGTTYMPLKVIGDALGVDVKWDDANKRVIVGHANYEVTPQVKKDVKIENIAVKTENGITAVAGEVVNNDTVMLSFVVGITFCDANSGKILGESSSAINNIEPGQTQVFIAISDKNYSQAKYYIDIFDLD